MLPAQDRRQYFLDRAMQIIYTALAKYRDQASLIHSNLHN